MSVLPTPRGKRLRALREYHNQTQLNVELEASLGIGYLQRLERGRVKQPERATLERILAALNAHYTDQREILELFGYIVAAPIPNQKEIDWAISVCQDELNRVIFPAYLLDCSHRLLYWNPFVPKLFRTHTLSPSYAPAMISMLKVIFDPMYRITLQIQNTDSFYSAQIRALRYEMQRFHGEMWYEDLIEDMLQYDSFARHWHQEKQQAIHIPARPLTPVEIQIDDKILSFRLISESFAQDHRFRVIFYLPTDSYTTQQCVSWERDALLII